MPPWDYDYYSRLDLEDLNVNYSQVAEYFPLQYVVSAMLGMNCHPTLSGTPKSNYGVVRQTQRP